MDRRHDTPAPSPGARTGLLLCCLIALVPVAWAAGWGWLSLLAALATLGVAAASVGADSRAPGDWKRAGL
jgi:hypothetical protein